MRLVGQHIKQYRLLEKLSEGEVGVVYKAFDTQRDAARTIVMLKPALAKNQAFMQRFGEEAGRLTQLNHPHIATVYAFHDDPESPFIVMEHVDAPTLEHLIREQGPLDYKRALPLFKQILEGLDYAHRKHVIHRGLKPSSVLVTPPIAGSEAGVKLVDFGLTQKPSGQDGAVAMLPPSTLYYMAPEHVRTTAEIDHRSDLYAVGMALYEALTGRTPFKEEDTAYIIMRAIVEEPFDPPTQGATAIPAPLAEVVMKALAKQPADRYQDAEAMRAALEAFEASVPVASAPPAAPEPPVAAPAAPEAAPEPAEGIPEAPQAPAEAPEPPARRARSWTTYLVLGLAVVVTVGLSWWALRDILATSTPAPVVTTEAVDEVVIQPGIYERILSSVGSLGDRQGRLLLKAMPYGSISLGGSILGEDSLEVTVAAGRRRVFFNHPVHGLRQFVVDVGPGQRKEVICYFEGFLRVQASDKDGLPLQAELFVDEQATGWKTPFERPYSLPPGSYMVEVFLAGYLGGAATVEVLPVADDSLLAMPPIEPLEFVLQRLEP